MAQAKRDGNRIPTILGVSNADGLTPVAIQANPTTHGLEVDDDTTGSDAGGSSARHDNNRVPTLIAVSSADGITPVAVYADPATGELLIDSS